MIHRRILVAFVWLAFASCTSASSNWDSLPSEWKSAAVWQCDSVDYNSENPAASKPDFSSQALISVKNMKICNQTGGMDNNIAIVDIDKVSYRQLMHKISLSRKFYGNEQGYQWNIDNVTGIGVERLQFEKEIINYYRCAPHQNLAAADERACFSPQQEGISLSILRPLNIP